MSLNRLQPDLPREDLPPAPACGGGAGARRAWRTTGHIVKQLIYISLALAFLKVCWFSFRIYTSLLPCRLPWWDPCGLQFAHIWFSIGPALVAIGTAQLVLGRFLPTSKATRVLPFAAATAIFLPCLLDPSLGLPMQLFGAACSALAAAAAIALAVRDLARANRRGPLP